MSAAFLPISTPAFHHHSRSGMRTLPSHNSIPAGLLLLPSHYSASVASLCFHQHLCPHAYIFVNLLNSFNQWLFNISANGCDFLQWRPNHHSAKHCWAALVLSGFFVTASLRSFIPYLLFPFSMELAFNSLKSTFESRTENKGLLCLYRRVPHMRTHACYSRCSGSPRWTAPWSRQIIDGSPPPGAKPVEGLQLKVYLSYWLNSNPRWVFYRSGSRTPASLTDQTALDEDMNSPHLMLWRRSTVWLFWS